jgi:voltage-gated potassium channel
MLLTSIGSQFWPATTEGRVLCVLLSLYGFATFGYITATFASFFVGRDAQKKDGPVAGSNRLEQLTREVRALRAALERGGPPSATASGAPGVPPSTPSPAGPAFPPTDDRRK